MITQIATNITTATQGPTYTPPVCGSGPHAVSLLQVEVTGSANVFIQGRLNDAAPWTNLNADSIAATSIISVTACPQMRINVTSIASGAVNAWITGTGVR
jgi:hypothetical protein